LYLNTLGVHRVDDGVNGDGAVFGELVGIGAEIEEDLFDSILIIVD
jgi:hypothetical protein